MADLPEPLATSECDCRGLPFMPLEVGRLIDSDFTGLSTGDEFKAAVILWAKSWGQIPAASIPDDDRILAKWAGYSLSEWMSLRTMALHNWIKCSDGRLYHPLIADLALKASQKRRGQSERANTRWAREKAKKGVKTAPAMPANTPGDATASAEDATAMQGRGTVEVKEEPPTPLEGGAKQDRRKPKRSLPDNFPTEDLIEEQQLKARTSGVDLDVSTEAEKFRNHALSQDRKVADWPAAWRNWVLKAIGWAPKVAALPLPSTADTDPWPSRMLKWRQAAYWDSDWGPKPGKPGCRAPAALVAPLPLPEIQPQPVDRSAAA